MKNSFLTFSILFVYSIGTSQNLIAHFPFDGNALDNSGNNHHGIPFGVAPTEDRFGNPEGAYLFDGIDDYVSVNDHPNLRLADTDYTISIWLKIEEYTNFVAHTLLSKRIFASNSGYLISVTGYDHPLDYTEGSFVMINSQNVDPTLQSEATNTLSEWTNLIITYCLDTEIFTFYINGVQDISGFLPPLNPSITADLLIGKDPLNNANKLLFEGSMDDVMIFNKKLNQEEIDEIVNPPFEFSLGPDIEMCEGESFVLDVSQSNPDAIIWQDGSTASTFTISESGTYFVTLTSNGIMTSDTIEVMQYPTLFLELGNDTLLCEESSFSILPQIDSNVDLDYLWSDESSENILTIEDSGIYELTISAEGFCPTSDTILVDFFSTSNIELGNDTILCLDQFLELIPSLLNDSFSYEWNTGETTSIISVNQDGIYSVTISNECGEFSDDIEVVFKNCRDIQIPNAFSPDLDGLNDYFNVISDGGVEIIENMKVFNRWGELVYEGINLNPNNPKEGWNGTSKGKPSSSDVYVYILTVVYRDGFREMFNGEITLVR